MAYPQINIIFDLDETLIHSRPTNNISAIKESLSGDYEIQKYAKGYVTIIRPIARELITFAKEISNNRVFIATVSQEDYAYPICKQLGINRVDVFTRSDISYCYNNKVSPLIANQRCILIDNLPSSKNQSKITVFKIKKYIQCNEFEPFIFKRGDETNHLNYIKKRIIDFTQ